MTTITAACLVYVSMATAYRDVTGAAHLIAMYAAHCTAIAQTASADNRETVAQACSSQTRTFAGMLRGLAFADIVSVFVVLVVGPGLTLILVTQFRRGLHIHT